MHPITLKAFTDTCQYCKYKMYMSVGYLNQVVEIVQWQVLTAPDSLNTGSRRCHKLSSKLWFIVTFTIALCASQEVTSRKLRGRLKEVP